MSYNGGVYSTPIMDEWTKDSIKLNWHYSEQVCSASRAALLTGRYSWLSGLNTVTTQLSHMHFDPSLTLYPELLEDAGYNNYIAGKWVSCCIYIYMLRSKCTNMYKCTVYK